MKPVLNSDFIYLSGYTGLVSAFKDMNPVIVFFGGLIAILVGIANLIKFYFFLKDRKNAKSKIINNSKNELPKYQTKVTGYNYDDTKADAT